MSHDGVTSKSTRDSFDLPVTGTAGRGRGIVLEGATLAWHHQDVWWRRSFNEIVAIDLEAEQGGDAPFARCTIRFTDSDRLALRVRIGDRGPSEETESYRAFVARLVDSLGPEQRERIAFRCGPSPTSRMASILTLAALLTGIAGVLVVGVVSGVTFREQGAWLAIPLLLLLGGVIVAALLGAVRVRRKLFDPNAIPPSVLPPAAGEPQ